MRSDLNFSEIVISSHIAILQLQNLLTNASALISKSFCNAKFLTRKLFPFIF